MEQRVTCRRARAAVLLLTLLGLLAMHGLPDAMAGPSSMTASLASTSMGQARTSMSTSTSAGHDLAAPMGCGMDHAGCVAVLRDAGRSAAADAAGTGFPAPDAVTPSPVSSPARTPRSPPDVSLIGLGISRT